MTEHVVSGEDDGRRHHALSHASDDLTPDLRDEDGDLRPEFLELLSEAIEARQAERVRALAGDLHEADVGDLLEALRPEDRVPFVHLLARPSTSPLSTEVDETIRLQVLEALPTATVVEGVKDLESDDAVALLEGLDEEDQDEILAGLPMPDRVALQRSLELSRGFGRAADADGLHRRAALWTVGQTIDTLREGQTCPRSSTRST